MCVSFRGLNKVTKSFEYPILRCDEAISVFQVGSCLILIITVEARQGYHQVIVWVNDKEKLAFFSPDDKKYYFKVMPFGPVNARPFYTIMMANLKKDWDLLFIETLKDYARNKTTAENMTVTFVDYDIFVGGTQLYSGIKSIIDDILIWSSSIGYILIYFECVCQVFQIQS